MPVTTRSLARVFSHEGTEIPDPSPGAKPEECLRILALSYPQFNNAALDGPFFRNGKALYQIKVAVGTKG